MIVMVAFQCLWESCHDNFISSEIGNIAAWQAWGFGGSTVFQNAFPRCWSAHSCPVFSSLKSLKSRSTCLWPPRKGFGVFELVCRVAPQAGNVST